MNPIESIAAQAAADDPLREAGRILAHLAASHRAKGSAVLVDRAEKPGILLTHGVVDGPLIASATTLWSARSPLLEAGQAASVRGLTLAPLRSETDLLGVVALWEHQPIDSGTLRLAQKHLSRALKTWRSVALSYLEATSPDTFLQEKLMLHLSKSGWNIAYVASVMNVTRNTIYSWLQKYRIVRPSPVTPSKVRG